MLSALVFRCETLTLDCWEPMCLQKSKLKWTAGPFRAAIGKASTQVVPEPGIFARAPFVQKNTPFYIIQRRGLEEEERKQPQQPHQARQQRPTPPSARPTESRRNWRS